MKKEAHKLFGIVEQDKDFVMCYKDFEQYALLYSRTFAEVQNKGKEGKMPHLINVFDDHISKYVKISSAKKSVIRRSLARYGIKNGQVAVGYRTMKELGINDIFEEKVAVESSNLFAYYLGNSDKYVKLTAWSGLVAFVLTLVSSIITIFSVFIELPFVK